MKAMERLRIIWRRLLDGTRKPPPHALKMKRPMRCGTPHLMMGGHVVLRNEASQD